MARRRREVAPDAASSTEPQVATDTSEPQATLTVRGSADAVKKQLGVAAAEAKPEPEKKKDGNGHDDEKQKFVDALRNPRYVVRVRRQSPRALAGHLWDQECPITYTKLQDETREGWGGGTFKAVIVDPESSKTVAGDTFDVPGDPLTQEPDMTPEERQKLFMEGGPKSATELSEEGLDRRARLSAKMLEVEALESQLEEARARRAGPKPAPQQDNSRVDDLERRLTEAKHQAEIERIQRDSDKKVDDLNKKIDQLLNAKPQKEENSTMMMLMEQMREDRKQSQAQFNALLTQMKDEKLNAVLDEVKSIRNKPAQQSGSLLDQAEAMLKLKKLFGWGGDEDEDEETDDPNDDRPWWEKALDKLGGKLGDKLFEKFTSMEEKGEKIDREKFMQEMSAHAQQVADAAVAAKTQRIPPPPAATPLLPPPPPPAVRHPSVPPHTPVTVLPPPPPAAAPPPEAAAPEPASQAVQVPPKMTLEQEIVIRVGGVLEMIDREVQVRPNEYHWNYEGCYLSLPESILEKVCAAPDPVAMLDAFAIEHINPEGVAGMKTKISANPRMLAWLKMGHDDLKEWWKQKQTDPKFDPFADEEEPEEEE